MSSPKIEKPGLFGKELRLRRQLARISLSEFARKIGMTKGYISGIETGSVNPPMPKVVKKLASFFRMNVKHYLMMAWADKAPKDIRKEMRAMVSSYMAGFM